MGEHKLAAEAREAIKAGIAGAPPLEVTSTPPQTDIPVSVFDFHNGDLGKVKRIVQRQQLKTRIKFYEQVIRIHQPLVKAIQITTKVFQDGVMEGIRQVAAAEREREAKAEAEATKAQQAAGIQAEVIPTTEGCQVSVQEPAA